MNDEAASLVMQLKPFFLKKSDWRNNEVEVKPFEAMFCGSILPGEVEMSFINGFTLKARNSL